MECDDGNQASLDFQIIFTAPGALRQAVDCMSHTLPEASFHVVSNEATPASVFLRCDSMDPSNTCCLKLKLLAQGHISETGDSTFAVKTKVFLTILKTMPPQDTVILQRWAGDPDVEIHASGIESHKYRIKTLDVIPRFTEMDDLRTLYNVEFEISRLKVSAHTSSHTPRRHVSNKKSYNEHIISKTQNYIKAALQMKSDRLRFQVFEGGGDGEQTTSSPSTISITLEAMGDDATATWRFENTSSYSGNENYQMCLSQSTTNDATSTKKMASYDSSFSTDYLQRFLKALDRHNAVIGLKKDMPLILEYPLGIEESSLRFILAEMITSSSFM